MSRWQVTVGDCVEVMRGLPECSVDAVVCDPPYGLEFMGKDWDAPWKNAETVRVTDEATNGIFYTKGFSHGVRYSRGQKEMRAFQEWCEVWAVEVLRVLKPGGHLLAFGGTRTFHRMTVAIEDAGFEVRDCLSWLYGSGFPKSLNVGKAIDKAAGAEREVVGKRNRVRNRQPTDKWERSNDESRVQSGNAGLSAVGGVWSPVTAPATAEAARWEGWGTALKPAWEPVVLARKPLVGTVAANVLEHGTGGLNIDGSRIEPSGDPIPPMRGKATLGGTGDGWDRPWKRDPEQVAAREVRAAAAIDKANTMGRWPANVLLDEDAAAILDQQSGYQKDGTTVTRNVDPDKVGSWLGTRKTLIGPDRGYGGSGGASRFFYVAKASRRDRNEGLDGMPEKRPDTRTSTGMGTFEEKGVAKQSNHHPTVKPTTLMRHLVRLVTPPDGLILDPFCGSGSTGKAAMLEGFRFHGIEQDPEYAEIARRRIGWAADNVDPQGTLL